MNRITVGIIGCGFVGGALRRWLAEHNPEVNVVVSDPPKGINDDISGADVYFLSIHVPTEANGTQDLTLMKNLIAGLPDKPIFIRTTIVPGTSAALSKELNKRVYFLPEFLTERTAYEDFSSQPMVFTAETELLSKIFVGKKFIEMTSLEAEITKYAHNVFGALNDICPLLLYSHCYYILYILPFFLLIRSAFIRYVFVLIIGLISAISAKRAIILSFIGASYVYLFVQNFFIEQKNKLFFMFIAPVIGIAIFGILVYYDSANYGFIFNRFDEISETGGNGRIDLWKYAIKTFFSSSPVEMLFGHGTYTFVMPEMPIIGFAHNDYLSTLIYITAQ